jgi:hypothetical protein
VDAQRLALYTLLIGTLAAFGGLYLWATPYVVGGASVVALLGGATTWRSDRGTRLL